MKLASMAERYQRPAWVRRINAMGDSVGGARRLLPLDAEACLATVAASLGGGGFGDFGDPRWRERFTSLVSALDAAELTAVGRLLTRQELLRSLRSRHLLARAWDEKPPIAGERIAAPVIVTGPARSGTSILFELLWLDPAFRAPLAWEALHPLPLPGETRDRRAEISECEQELWADVQPEFAAIHELRSDLPVECVTLTAPCFCGPHWPMCVQMPAWAPDVPVQMPAWAPDVPVQMPAWAPDVPEMYRFHRRILQVLQHGSEARTWLLKTPGHLMTLDLVFATYPDAWVVQTHRDPAKTMPSTVSTTAMVQWLRSEHVDLGALAAGIEAAFTAALNGVAGARAKGALPDRFVDVHFQALMRDPVATLRASYARMGRPFGAEHAQRIREYLAAKPKGKFGAHRYTPEEWGFDARALRERLAPYLERFGVEVED